MANAILGIDFGRSRVGLALADTEENAPKRFKTIVNDDGLVRRLQVIITEHSVVTAVVGLPRGVDGEETAQTALVREFVRTLESAIEVNVELQDEFATSEMAEERLEITGRPTPEQRPLIDQEAAVIILEDYLAKQ